MSVIIKTNLSFFCMQRSSQTRETSVNSLFHRSTFLKNSALIKSVGPPPPPQTLYVLVIQFSLRICKTKTWQEQRKQRRLFGTVWFFYHQYIFGFLKLFFLYFTVVKMLFHLLLVFRETSGDGIGCLLECSGAAPLVNNCFSLLRSVDIVMCIHVLMHYISIV